MDEIYRFKTPEKISEGLDKFLMTGDSLDKKSLILRRFKLYEELRIGVRYLIKETDLEGTLFDLSNLADVFLQAVFKLAFEEVSRKNGHTIPEKLCIVGLGKYGGGELNFGSDLDIIFVYDGSEEDSLEGIQYLSLIHI